jgi:cytochrome c oxidase subunit 2
VQTLLRSKDVLHDFAVPQFRVKMDLVPGMVSYVWFEPTRTGRFELLCEELCGIAHHTMRGIVIVDEEKDYQDWLASQPTFAQVMAEASGDAAVGQAQYAVCVSCHGAKGEGIKDLMAPKLAGQEDWYLRNQLQLYKSGGRGQHKDDVYGQQMAAMANTLVNDAAINNVIAYIKTFPDTPAPATVQGDINHGKKLYTTCAACHGYAGQGIWALNAPRQRGMSDWYLAAQLSNFKQGIRGKHPQDRYGPQMALMAATLQDDQAINDVIAYINTLK